MAFSTLKRCVALQSNGAAYIADAPLNLIGLQLLQRGSTLVTTLRLGVSHLGVTYLIRAHFLIHWQPLPPPLLTAATGRLRGVYRSRGA